MEEKIIEFVQNNKFLYDLSEPNYRKVHLKDKAWADLALELKTDVSTVKKRWKGLKDGWYRENAKRKNVPSGSGAVHRTHWKWYESLGFLNQMRDDRPATSSNLICESDDHDLSFSESSQHSPMPETPEKPPNKRAKQMDMLKSMHEEFVKVGNHIQTRLQGQESKSADFFKHCQGLVDKSNISQPEFIELQKKILNHIYDAISKE